MINIRTCGTCIKCCDGNLDVVINEHVVQKGSPCPYVSIHTGCTIYEDPSKPSICREFECSWKKDYHIPEWLKPEHSNVIIVYKMFEGMDYTQAIETDSVVLSSQALNWLITDAIKWKSNLVYQIGSRGFYCMGSVAFCKAWMNKHNGVGIAYAE